MLFLKISLLANISIRFFLDLVPPCTEIPEFLFMTTKLSLSSIIWSSFDFIISFDGLNFITSEGVLKGNIILEPRGKNGFGYDPIFDVNGKTLAEMTLEEKSNISHRKIAAVKLVEMLNENKV